MPRRGSKKHNGPEGQCRAQCPRRAAQSTVPQRGSAEHCPIRVIKAQHPRSAVNTA